MVRYTGGCRCGNVRVVASGRPYRVGLCHCLDCRKHRGALFHACAVFPQDAMAIDGETRDHAGRFICPPLRLARFRAHRRRDRSQLGIPGCPGPVGADLRTLDHPPRVLVAAVSAHETPRPRSWRHESLRGVGRTHSGFRLLAPTHRVTSRTVRPCLPRLGMSTGTGRSPKRRVSRHVGACGYFGRARSTLQSVRPVQRDARHAPLDEGAPSVPHA